MISALTKNADVSQSKIQVLTVPFDANWDEDPEQLNNFCDSVPFASGFYESSGFTIREQYISFINNINKARDNQIASPSDKVELDKWSKIHTEKTQKLFPAQIECAMQYKSSSPSISYEQFEKKCTKYQNLKKEIEDANNWIEWHSAFAYGLEYASLVQSRMQSKAISAMGFKEIGESLADFKASIKRGETNPLNIQFSLRADSRKAESYEKFVQGLKRPSSLNGSLFSLMSGPTAKGLTTTTDKFQMNISFQSYRRIRLAPGSWFSSDVIQNFKKGPFIHSQRQLFGNNGSMTLLPKAVYIAVKPTIEMIVNKQDEFTFNKSVSEGKGGLFSSKKVTAEINSKFLSEDTYKVTIKTNSPVPQVIAVDFDQL